MINRVVLVGNLTRDPELRYTPSGVAVAKFGIAVNEYRKDEQGQAKEIAHFFNIVTWRQSAEFAANYLTKGTRVGIDGRLQYNAWVDQNGQKRSTVEIVADRIESLSSRPREDSEGAATPGGAPAGGTTAPDLGPEDYHDPFADE